MHGMTEPESACPVCATPHAPDATTCGFCGVVFAELEPDADAQPVLSDREIAREIAAETDAPIGSETGAPAEAVQADPLPVVVETIATDDAGEAIDVAEAAEVDAIDAVATVSDDAIPAESVEDGEDVDREDAAVEPGIVDAPETTGIELDAVSPAPAKPRTKVPSFARAPTAAGLAQRKRHRIERGIVAGLAALLMVQVVASDFGPLAANASTRPWLQRMCDALRCTLPPWREPQALRMLQRDVRSDPKRPGLLRISASFRNDARWAQPWPRLRVTLADADGRAIAARDVSAREYLGATATAKGIASGQVAGVAFDVVDPSPRVTAFTFEFR